MPPQQRSTSLPDSRTVLTSIIDEIATLRYLASSNLVNNSDPDIIRSNTLSALEGKEKTVLLTLHVLLPNETLPALDLLERGCVQRFVITRSAVRDQVTDSRAGGGPVAPPAPDRPEKHVVAYYVQSASSLHQHQAASSRFVNRDLPRSYEVRLQAWHCSCPAFAFSAFPARLRSEETGDTAVGEGDEGEGKDGEEMVLDGVEEDIKGMERAWRFGGLGRGIDAAVCKHLIACLLGERCPLFQNFVQEKEVSVEEAAGWSAGWGA